MSEIQYDVIVAGGGGSGLTVAYRLGRAGHSVLILEKEDRVGGRTLSGQIDNHCPYNLGTQFMVGDVGPVVDLRNELAIPVRPISMTPLAWYSQGKLVTGRSNLGLLLRLPLSLPAKISLVLNMRRFQAQAFKFYQPGWPSQHAARMNELDAQPYSEAIKHIHPEARPFFELLAGDLCANRPESVASIGGLVSTLAFEFGQAYVAEEGNETLHQALLKHSHAQVIQRATVVDMRLSDSGVAVTYNCDGSEQLVHARFAVSSLPADVVLDVVKDLPESKKAALKNVIYGPFVSAVFLTDETGAARWRDIAMMVVLDKSFSFVVNQSNAYYGSREGQRQGSAIFTMAVTEKAQRLLERPVEEVREIVRRDMLSIFPEMAPVLRHVLVHKWPRGLPGFRPGAYGQTAIRKAPHGQIYFAGDYLGDTTASLRSAVASAEDCSAQILQRLAAGSDTGRTKPAIA